MEIAPAATATLEAGIGDSGQLFRLQLRVARRADALARRAGPWSREEDRRVWMRAELEAYDDRGCDRTAERWKP